LWGVALAGLVGACFRLWFGLGATTHLSDAVPWGVWKILNMVGGVALSTSGFAVGFLVYVLRLKRFQPFLKPAILIAFLGYGCSCMALLFDIGLPHRFWRPIVSWNIDSFLFEVFWCVMLYFTVTAIELAPLLLERLRAARAVRILHRIAFAVVVVGISLSSLHHSSLGSLFLVTPQRLHPLWYTPWLPLLFISSAVGAGLMVVVLVELLWQRWYSPASGACVGARRTVSRFGTCGAGEAVFSPDPQNPTMARIRSLATIAATVLAFYLVLKVVDLFLHGGWQPLLAGTWESWLYAVEVTLGAILPILLMALPRSRNSVGGITGASAAAALGLALNRLDVGVFGYVRDAGVLYFPSLTKWMVSFGVVAAAGLVFFFAAENLPVFGDELPDTCRFVRRFRFTYGSFGQVWDAALADSLRRVTLIAVFVIPLAFVLMYPPFFRGAASGSTVRPATGMDALRSKLRIDGDHGGVLTVFDHADHQKRLGGSTSCVRCHHLSFPQDKSTPCSRCHQRMDNPTELFDHEFHLSAVAARDHLSGLHPANHSCVQCHPAQRPKASSGAKDCLECHKQDMLPVAIPAEPPDLRLAVSFREAMHRTCIECHASEGKRLDKQRLGDCQTCHDSLRARPPRATLARVAQTLTTRNGGKLGH